MKIAVTYENGNIFQHFGHTETFMIYNVADKKVTSFEALSAEGSGHDALAGLLKANGIDVLICGGIGQGAKSALERAGIRLYSGASGSADAAVAALIDGKLPKRSEATCDSHDHSCSGHCCH